MGPNYQAGKENIQWALQKRELRLYHVKQSAGGVSLFQEIVFF